MADVTDRRDETILKLSICVYDINRNSNRKKNKMKDIEEIIAKFADLYDRAEHRVNVLDFAPMSENAHTSFLKAVLSHKRCDKLVFVNSFLKRVFDDVYFQDTSFEIKEQSKIENGRILDLCIESNSYYIVLENKVCLAKDGDRQMQDYWEHCERVAKEKRKEPRLVYLTLAGGAPATWSIGEKEVEELRKGKHYFECSYRDEILTWFIEDVLPYCLQSETSLFHSVSIYVDAINRKAGGVSNGRLAENAKRALESNGWIEDVLSKDGYAKICAISTFEQKCENATDSQNKVDKAHAVAMILQNWCLARRIYLDPWQTAYNLKWLLKNNPTIEYKNRGRFDVGSFTSIGQFTYCGCRYVQLATCEGLRIHINCHGFDGGMKEGPYVLSEISQLEIPSKDFEDAGFVKKGDAYYFPMQKFDPKKTALEDVARHIEKMIRTLERLAPKLCKC